MTFGEKLLSLRQRAGMSQDALAEKLDVSRQAVSKWERDEAAPETDKIVKLAQLFQVSTDYLLLDTPKSQQAATFQQPRPQSFRGDRIERFIRRHGYKAGYFLIAGGIFLCILALLIFTLLPRFGSGLFDSAYIDSGMENNGIYMEGDLPPEVLDQIYGQAGSGLDSGGIFDSIEDEFNQQVSQIQQGWTRTFGIMVAFAGVPLLLMGIALITLGTMIVVKGKKFASQTA